MKANWRGCTPSLTQNTAHAWRYTAASLAQARQRLNAGPPQLVLLDDYLPDGKGVR